MEIKKEIQNWQVLISFMAVLQFIALYYFKSLKYLVLIVIHSYIHTVKGLSFMEKDG